MIKTPTLDAQIERSESLTDQAEAILRKSLMSGALKPGQTLTIRGLSAMLGVSVTPAKDSMGRLIAERVLEWGPRRTALVPALSMEDVDEIYTIRFALESTAAVAAMPAFDKEALENLEGIADRLARNRTNQDYGTMIANNYDFHFAIYRQSNLPLLIKLIEGLWLRMGPSLNLLYSNFSKRDWARGGTGFHEEIINALRDRDEAAVRQHIVLDLTNGRDRFKNLAAPQKTAKARSAT